MKNINFGWSLGYLQGLNTPAYRSVIEYAVNHGTNRFRFYDPWIKGFDNAAIVAMVDFLSWYGKAEVLITLSNAPYGWLVDYDLTKLTANQQRATAYTNRFMPKAMQAYSDLIKDLVRRLDEKKLLQYVSFELGNEPDAEKFWWGTFDEFEEITRLKYDAVKASGRPVYIGDFTSSLMRDKTYRGKQRWWDYIDQEPMLNEVGFSHSFYHYDSSNLQFNLKDNTYPTRKFTNTVVSEYNIYTSMRPGSERERVFNSTQYVKYLCDMLRFFYDKPVSTVYVHTLFKYGNDDNGTMGHYDGKAPRPAALLFWKVWDVIKTNAKKLSEPAAQYELLDNGIKGPATSIVFDEKGQFTIVKSSSV